MSVLGVSVLGLRSWYVFVVLHDVVFFFVVVLAIIVMYYFLHGRDDF